MKKTCSQIFHLLVKMCNELFTSPVLFDRDTIYFSQNFKSFLFIGGNIPMDIQNSWDISYA